MMDVSYVLSLPATERLICIDERTLDMVRFLLFEYGSRQVNFYRSLAPAGYYTPTDEERDVLDDLIGAFLFSTSEGYMGCMEDLINAINQLSLSVSGSISNSGGCGCSGVGGAGLFEAQASTFEDSGANFPNGYANWAEYSASKCNLAQHIITGWIDDLTRLRQVDVAGKSAEALVAVFVLSFLLPIPFVNILAIAVAVLALVAISIDAFTDAIDELIAWLQGLDICLLYGAATATDAQAAMAEDLDSQTFTQDTLTKALFNYFLNFDTLNLLFDPKSDTLDASMLPAGDCSDCLYGCQSGFSIALGTGPSIAEGYFTEPFVSQSYSGYQYLQVTSFKLGLPIKFVSISGWASGNPPDQFRIADGGDGTSGNLYTGDTFPTGQTFDPSVDGNIAFIFSGNGPFEVVLECGL